MKMLLLAAALIATAACAAAQGEEKASAPKDQLCPAGQALTYTLQCDQGVSSSTDLALHPGKPRVAICKASSMTCAPVLHPYVAARPGFEVQDSPWGQLVVVEFGLNRLLGDEP